MTLSTEFGVNRVLLPEGALPQAAEVLEPAGPILSTEALVRVEKLNLDSASFQQIREAYGPQVEPMRQAILDIVLKRGKMQNPVTGSGGVLIGEIVETGSNFEGGGVRGDRIVTLVSLSATPLSLEAISGEWVGDTPVIPVVGSAVLTDGAVYARIPDDLPEAVSLAVLDVCGAPALANRILVRRAIDGRRPQRLLILGGGKSASLSAVAARAIGIDVTIVVPSEIEQKRLLQHEIADHIVIADATLPLSTRRLIMGEHGADELPDVTLVCVNVPGVEHTALLSTRPGGAVVYFSMATGFSTVALGAEAFGLDLDLIIGSGYVPGHADEALQLLREHPNLLNFFETL